MLSPSTLTIDNCSAFAILLSLKLIELQVHSFFELTSLQDEMHSLSPSRNSNLQLSMSIGKMPKGIGQV